MPSPIRALCLALVGLSGCIAGGETSGSHELTACRPSTFWAYRISSASGESSP